jgi:hypothetical protein
MIELSSKVIKLSRISGLNDWNNLWVNILMGKTLSWDFQRLLKSTHSNGQNQERLIQWSNIWAFNLNDHCNNILLESDRSGCVCVKRYCNGLVYFLLYVLINVIVVYDNRCYVVVWITIGYRYVNIK